MKISGVEIDIQDIMSRARSAIIRELGEKPWKFESESRLDQMNLVMRGQVWDELTRCLQSSCGEQEGSVKAEEAVAQAMRNGLAKNNIRFRKKAFIIQLKNTRLKVYKRESGFEAGPEMLGGYGAVKLGWCSPSMFADLMFTYDTLVPQIDSATAPLLEEMLEEKRRYEREKMAERVQMTAVNSLIEKYLSPLGIMCTPTINGNKVSLQLELLKRGRIEASIEDLPALLEDTSAIMEGLKPVNEKKVFFFR